MTNRREFLAALAAVFAGVVLPVPVREAIWVPSATLRLMDDREHTVAELDRLLKQVYREPVHASFGSPRQFMDLDRAFKRALYTSDPGPRAVHTVDPQYFNLPGQT